MNIYKFSYDDKEDAIRSLANYYQVSDKVILIKGKTVCNDLEKRKDKIYGENEHLMGVREEELSEKIKLEKDKFFYELKNELSPNYSKSNDPIIRINFYHRCSSDGRDSWFQEGLLNSVDGIECFMKKLDSLVNIKLDRKKQLSGYKFGVIKENGIMKKDPVKKIVFSIGLKINYQTYKSHQTTMK